MKIESFTAGHLDQAGEIALKLWGSEIPGMPSEIRRIIYDYLPCYYFDETSPFNLAAMENGKLQGLLLASADFPEPAGANMQLQKRIPAEYAFYGQTYQAYLDGNRRLEEQFKTAQDIQLLFFASIRPGCGKLLMQEFIYRGRQCGFEKMLLWTDNTCNFQYYFDHDFELLHRTPADPGITGMNLETMLFRRNLS